MNNRAEYLMYGWLRLHEKYVNGYLFEEYKDRGMDFKHWRYCRDKAVYCYRRYKAAAKRLNPNPSKE